MKEKHTRRSVQGVAAVKQRALWEQRGPSLRLLKTTTTSNLIKKKGAALHVMRCHLFQVCSRCFGTSNVEMFSPGAAIEPDKEPSRRSVAIESSGSGCL